MKKSAPSTRAAKAQSRYSAFEGQTRTCTECGESKPISNRTFALKNKGPDGLSETCRQCDGSRAGKRVKHPKAPKGFQADPRYEWEAFCLEIDSKVQALTELTQAKVKRLDEIKQIKADLTSVTRLEWDPAPGGLATDERIAFKTFMRVLKPVLSGWKELGEVHEDIISALLCPDTNTVLLATRNSAKSTICSQYAVWKLWRAPEHETVLIVSRGDNLARRMLKSCRAYIALSPLLRDELEPDEEQQDSQTQFEVRPAKGKLGMSCSLTTKGITSSLPGLRASLVIGDDVESNQDNCVEHADLLEERLSEFTNILNPNGRIVLLGTPQHQWSIYGRLERDPAWTVFRAPMFTSDILDGREVFHSRWPERFSPEEFEKRKRTLPRLKFDLHYRIALESTADDVQPLRLGDLPVIDVSSNSLRYPVVMQGGGPILNNLPRGSAVPGDNWRGLAEFSDDACGVTMTIGACDPASGLKGLDAIGLSVVSVTESGNVIIRHCSGYRAATMNQAMQSVASTLSRFRVNQLLVEEGANGLFGQTLSQMMASRGHPIRYERVNTTGQRKGIRIIESIAPALASQRVFICKDVLTEPDAVEVVNQFTSVREDGRKLKHDDQLDSLAYCLAALGPVLSSDQATLIASSRVSYEALKKLPWRATLMTDEEMKAYGEIDENMQALRLKRDHIAKTLQEDAIRGKYDPGLQAYLEKIEEELSRIDTGKVISLKSSLRRYAEKEDAYRKDKNINEGHISLAA